MNAPCHGCPNRRENCHSMCQEYRYYTVVKQAERHYARSGQTSQINVLDYTRRVRNQGERERKRRAAGWFTAE